MRIHITDQLEKAEAEVAGIYMLMLDVYSTKESLISKALFLSLCKQFHSAIKGYRGVTKEGILQLEKSFTVIKGRDTDIAYMDELVEKQRTTISIQVGIIDDKDCELNKAKEIMIDKNNIILTQLRKINKLRGIIKDKDKYSYSELNRLAKKKIETLNKKADGAD